MDLFSDKKKQTGPINNWTSQQNEEELKDFNEEIWFERAVSKPPPSKVQPVARANPFATGQTNLKFAFGQSQIQQPTFPQQQASVNPFAMLKKPAQQVTFPNATDLRKPIQNSPPAQSFAQHARFSVQPQQPVFRVARLQNNPGTQAVMQQPVMQ